MNNKNYRVMKFFEQVNKPNKAKGYVRLDIRGTRGNIIVSAEGLEDSRSLSEVYLYKDRENKLKLGDINNKKGMLKKSLTFGSESSVEEYNTCAVVQDKKIVLYTNLFSASSLEHVKKLECCDEDDDATFDNAEISDDMLTEKSETEEPAEEKERLQAEIVDENRENEAIAEEKNVEQMATDINDSRTRKESVTSAVNLNAEPDIEAQARRYKNKFEESLYYALRNYKIVEPLSVKIKEFDWWYIPYDETGIKNGFLPYYNQIISSYYPYPVSNRVTTCSGLMKKYGHYVFGIFKEKGEIAKFVYGVPGTFSKEEQPYKGITGFKNWSYSNKGEDADYGYWLAFVNPRSGETTEPPEIVLS